MFVFFLVLCIIVADADFRLRSQILGEEEEEGISNAEPTLCTVELITDKLLVLIFEARPRAAVSVPYIAALWKPASLRSSQSLKGAEQSTKLQGNEKDIQKFILFFVLRREKTPKNGRALFCF